MNPLETEINPTHREHNIIPPFNIWIYSEIISNYCKNRTKHIYNLRQKGSEFVLSNVTAYTYNTNN